MTRVLVQFLIGYSRYNKGETAGFDKAKAEQLCSGKAPVARLVGPVKRASEQAATDVDLLERDRQELDQANANLADQLADLDQREQDLAVREAALAERELELQAARVTSVKQASEAGLSKEPAAQAVADPEPKDKAPGAPPKQGAKA
ncbi:hypothetical protein [Pseudophaeobacter flagellatus]|uniref:hypothetical protein n=1 Tax=Pseudophaeobacter flagellatus TaxID=2899119 RepID=UPI001E5857FC|nr:hypothetical protein [Pseudophaeobacter flagellatus]MCD9148997.1 hypothetical protein [Pseudophaeobacter flagellatus]